jgi:hypothetical protein
LLSCKRHSGSLLRWVGMEAEPVMPALLEGSWRPQPVRSGGECTSRPPGKLLLHASHGGGRGWPTTLSCVATAVTCLLIWRQRRNEPFLVIRSVMPESHVRGQYDWLPPHHIYPGVPGTSRSRVLQSNAYSSGLYSSTEQDDWAATSTGL